MAPSTVDKQAPTVAEEHAPSTNSPEATDIPTANAPDPKAANPETNPNAAKPAAAPPKREKPAAKAATEEKPAAKAAAKKEKAPAVEDKPFVEFIEQDYLPAVQKAIAQARCKRFTIVFCQAEASYRWLSISRRMLASYWQLAKWSAPV